jgi:protein-S-isoprenylcysteine O-methyltransferase Ste14
MRATREQDRKRLEMNNLYLRATGRFLQLLLLLAAFVFLPAGTFDYWEGWLFSAVFAACSLAITIYLAVNDPQLLDRRMQIGPAAETERSQKIIMVAILLTFAGVPTLSATDHRLGWSSVPIVVVVLGDLLIVFAHIGFCLVFRANTYGAATIQVTEGQAVISSGPYAVVRHPMYAWNLPMILGTALALGSWWGTLLVVPMIAGLVARILYEERYLAANLAGYAQYVRKVQCRLIPFVW